jgi:hypothetical protein
VVPITRGYNAGSGQCAKPILLELSVPAMVCERL